LPAPPGKFRGKGKKGNVGSVNGFGRRDFVVEMPAQKAEARRERDHVTTPRRAFLVGRV